MADDTMVFFDTKAGPRSARNNHRYWAALALATVGSLTGDHNKIEWARQSYRIGVCQVTEDGTLPLEMQRERLRATTISMLFVRWLAHSSRSERSVNHSMTFALALSSDWPKPR
ncbi:alginate lyase family protein [Rhizobium sp. AN95]|nr:alginate lyase family protein [Rhizobium sp. AN95]